MVRDILTVVDDSALAGPVLEFLAEISERHDLRLLVSVLTPSPLLSPRLAPFGSLYEPSSSQKEDADAATMAVRSALASVAGRVEISSMFDDVGFLPGDVRRAPVLADMAVIGSAETWAVPWLRRHVVEALLFASGLPVLLLPDTPRAEGFEHVVVGWQRKPQAIRALREALAMARPGARIELVSVGEADPGDDGFFCGEKTFLSRRGFDAHCHTIPEADDVAERLQSYALRHKATLLVVGAYGHARFRETVLGGVTRSLIERVRIPVLLAH